MAAKQSRRESSSLLPVVKKQEIRTGFTKPHSAPPPPNNASLTWKVDAKARSLTPGDNPSPLAESSPTYGINAAFMWEIKTVNAELWSLFDRLLQYCERPTLILREPRVFIDNLEHLLDLVAMQFTLEEAYGYFEDPEVVEISICKQALVLRTEHASLYRNLMELIDRAQQFYFDDEVLLMANQMPLQFEAYVCQFRAHDELECDLTMRAMNQELGEGD